MKGDPIRIGELNVVYGPLPDLPVKIPKGVTRWKIRARAQCFATIFLKFNDRIERRYVGREGDFLVPYAKLAENRSK